MPPLSILDLAFVPEGGTPADALRNTLDLAQHAEKWGYRRFWLAERIRDSRIGGGNTRSEDQKLHDINRSLEGQLPVIRSPSLLGMGPPRRTRTMIT
jgi:hypothetical protein